ncbi:hypothetical protein L9F63_026385, partial [Diploptera punctata]
NLIGFMIITSLDISKSPTMHSNCRFFNFTIFNISKMFFGTSFQIPFSFSYINFIAIFTTYLINSRFLTVWDIDFLLVPRRLPRLNLFIGAKVILNLSIFYAFQDDHQKLLKHLEKHMELTIWENIFIQKNKYGSMKFEVPGEPPSSLFSENTYLVSSLLCHIIDVFQLLFCSCPS